MKATLLRIGLTALSSLTALSAANAQTLPNGTLETWSARGFTQAPNGWFTFDDILASLGIPFPVATTTRSTDKHAGTYAALLETKTIALLNDAVIPGVLGIGTKASLDADFPGGIPFTGRPAAMQFYYKYTTPNANELAGAQVVLTKWNGTESEAVAIGELELVPVASYTLRTVPLQYFSGAAPDSIRILFSSTINEQPLVGARLFIDDVIMTGTATTTVDAARNAAVTVYPNPSADGRFLLSAARQTSWVQAPYTVADVTGRIVVRQAAAPANTTGPRTVDLQGQRVGVYTLRLETPEGPVIHKLLIP